MDLTHPLGISFCQVIIDRNDMNALAVQCIQVGRKGGYQCLTFTSLHLRNTSLMQNNAADQLNPIMTHTKNSVCRLTNNRKGFNQQIIQRLSLCKPLFKGTCLISQLFI